MSTDTPPRRVQLFCNPASGSYSPATIAALTAAFKARGAIVLPDYSVDAPPVLADGVTHVCIAAGDGTVRHIGAAVAASKQTPVLGIYPSGTVNLLAKEGAYPRDPEQFAEHLLNGTTVRLHYPVALGADGLFFACASAGPDAAAVARVSMRLKRRIGRFAYVLAFLTELRSWQRRRLALVADGERIDCEAFFVAKGRYFAGRWTLAAEACVEIPALFLVALTRACRRDYARFAWALLRGDDLSKLPGVLTRTCVTLHASAATPTLLQADGDILTTLPATFSLKEPLTFR